MPGLHLDNNGLEWLSFEVQAGAPSNPAASNARMWFESDGAHILDSSGKESIFGYSTVTLTNGGVSAVVSSDGATGIVGTISNHSLLLKTNNTTAITISNAQAITMVGNVTIQNAANPTLFITHTGGATAFIQSYGSAPDFRFGTATNHPVVIFTNNGVAATFTTAQGITLPGAFNHTGSTFGTLGATPAAQRAHVANPAGGTTVDAEARAAINSILVTFETFGFHATS